VPGIVLENQTARKIIEVLIRPCGDGVSAEYQRQGNECGEQTQCGDEQEQFLNQVILTPLGVHQIGVVTCEVGEGEPTQAAVMDDFGGYDAENDQNNPEQDSLYGVPTFDVMVFIAPLEKIWQGKRRRWEAKKQQHQNVIKPGLIVPCNLTLYEFQLVSNEGLKELSAQMLVDAEDPPAENEQQSQ
jgi:hypothetical protein